MPLLSLNATARRGVYRSLTPGFEYFVKKGEEREEMSKPNLLSGNIRLVARLDLEAAVVRPQVHAAGYARHAPLVHHLRGLRTSDGELDVRILLPVSEEQWELGQEAVVHGARGLDGGWGGVAVQTSFLRLGRADELLPRLELVWIL